MKKALIGSALALLVLFGVFINKRNNLYKPSPVAEEEIEFEVGLDSLVSISDEITLLDVRSDVEWSEEHIDGAIHLDIEDIKQGALPGVEKDEPLYIYCRSGNRAGQAVEILKDAGYTNLINIGGLSDWKAAGGDTVTLEEDCVNC